MALTLGQRALDVARAKIGEREYGGANQGPIVEWSLRNLASLPLTGLPWCAYFVWQCLLQAADTDDQKGRVLALASGSCTTSYQRLARAGFTTLADRCKSDEPGPGWLVFFRRHGGIHHVGLVESADVRTIRTIEGNHSDRVAAAQYARIHATIFGYAEVRL